MESKQKINLEGRFRDKLFSCKLSKMFRRSTVEKNGDNKIAFYPFT